jgi:hypothetical protein
VRVGRSSIRQIGGLFAASTVLMVAGIAAATPAAAIAISITTTTIANPTAGAAYSQPISVANDVPPDAFVTTGTPPPGITINPTTGVLSGVPTAAGPFTFGVTVTDSAAGTASENYSVTVSPPNISISPTTLPTGSVNVAYSQQITPSGGTAPYMYGLALGSTLPPGVTLSPSGLLSGTPTTGGSYTVNVQVTDSTTGAGEPFIAVRPYTLQVGLPQTIGITNPGAKPLGASFSLTATSTSGATVTFTSATPSICTVAGTTVTPVAIGSCTINGDAPATGAYLAAPQTPVTFAIQALPATITVAGNPTTSVYGQPVTFTATVGTPVPTGTLQWSVDGTNVGAAVTLSTTTTSYTFTPTSALAVGTHTVKATYSGDATHGPANGQATETVSKANTTATVAVNGETLTVTVAPVSPGAGTPTGTVTFSVNGVQAGTAPLSNGVATFTGTSVNNNAVSVSYPGDANFNASSGNRSALPPTVTKHVSSTSRKTLAGWYNAPVTVSFTCTPNTAPIVTCPAPQTLSRNGHGQSVTETVTATDGGTTTVSVTNINIDKNAPTLRVKRKGIRLSCHALDGLSGVKSCRITRRQHVHNGVRTVRWTAVARDHAGNSRTKHGTFSYLV